MEGHSHSVTCAEGLPAPWEGSRADTARTTRAPALRFPARGRMTVTFRINKAADMVNGRGWPSTDRS